MKLSWLHKIILGRGLSWLKKEYNMKSIVAWFSGKKTYIFTALYALGAFTQFMATGDFTVESVSMLLQQIAGSGAAASFRAGIKKVGKE